MSSLAVGSHVISSTSPTVVIAEIGVNHDGSVNRALDLVRLAKNCGADAVKLQIFRATTLMHASGKFAEYQKERGKAATPIEMLRKYELAADEVRRVVQTIRELEMLPLATPFSPTDVNMIAGLRLPGVKIASPDLVNRPLLFAASQLNLPMLISTGAATMDEVRTTVGWLKEWGTPFTLLHCVSSYPTPAEYANLCWISELAREFDVPAGYSDHTNTLTAGALAVAAGACAIEKHLTYDRSAKGPDHAASSDPQQFERYVRAIREADTLRGKPGKHVLGIENEVREISRQSLVLRRSLAQGDVLNEEDLTVQRPGTGVPAAMIKQTVGRRTLRALNAGVLLQWDMLTDAA